MTYDFKHSFRVFINPWLWKKISRYPLNVLFSFCHFLDYHNLREREREREREGECQTHLEYEDISWPPTLLVRTQLVCEDKSLSSQTTLVYLNAQLKKHMQTSYHVMRTKNLWGHGYLPCLLSAALCNSNFWKGHHWACQRFLNSSLLSRQSWYRIQSEAGCKVSHFGALTGT